MYYKIADCVVQYKPIYGLLGGQMEAYRCGESKPDIVLHITKEFCKEQQRENPHLTEAQCEYIFAGAEFYRKLLAFEGFVLHASAVTMDGKAYLFSADSGTGKSTHTKQWQKYFGADKANILNDDKPAIKLEGEKFIAYGTPFSGKSDENLNIKRDLQGICMLERGVKNKIWRINSREAIPLLIKQTILPRKEQSIDQLFFMLDKLLKDVPVYRMQCNISEEAAKMAYETMRGEKK